eukprot:3418240-Alexandrium_andersonii.AAC.1
MNMLGRSRARASAPSGDEAPRRIQMHRVDAPACAIVAGLCLIIVAPQRLERHERGLALVLARS